MDDLSNRSTSLGGGSGPAPGDPLTGLTGAIEQTGGLDSLVGKLRDGGLASEVDSWVSTGTNRPVDAQRLGQALGPDTVQQLSAGSGIDVGALLPLLAMFLPQIVDMLTPNGSAPSGGLDSAAGQGGMPDLGGLLGGLLGGVAGAGDAGRPGATGAAGTGDLSDLLRDLGGPPDRR